MFPLPNPQVRKEETCSRGLVLGQVVGKRWGGREVRLG